MKFINLDTLKIEESGDNNLVLIKTVKLHGLKKNKGIKSFFNEVREELSTQINWEDGVENTNDIVYFDIVYDGKMAADDEDDIRYIINIVIGAFVEEMIDGENRIGRSREHRLGVPDSFNELYLSVMNIKKLINYKTKVDKFILNIRSVNNEFIYNAIGNEEGESTNDAA